MGFGSEGYHSTSSSAQVQGQCVLDPSLVGCLKLGCGAAKRAPCLVVRDPPAALDDFDASGVLATWRSSDGPWADLVRVW